MWHKAISGSLFNTDVALKTTTSASSALVWMELGGGTFHQVDVVDVISSMLWYVVFEAL